MLPNWMSKDTIAKTGTTTVGMTMKNAVVFATDTRVTSGLFIAHKRGKKLFPLADHIAITVAGRYADAQTIIDLLRSNIKYFQISNQRPMGVKSASRLAANTLFTSRAFPLLAQVMIGGVDLSGAHLFNIDFTGTLTEEKIISTGSGSPIAYGIIEAEYDEDMPLTKAIDLAAKAVAGAIKRDVGTGDSIDIGYISKEMKYIELDKEEKMGYVSQYFKPIS